MTMMRYRRETDSRLEKIILSIDLQELKDIPLFGDDKWYAAEEILLLTLMQNHSYGNWSLFAEILSEKFHKKFTPEEVEEHYTNTYLEGDIAKAMKKTESNTPKSSLIDHSSKEDAECLKSADMKACENVPQEFLEKIGYMPLREDFEREYDPSAEDLTQNVDFSLTTDSYDRNVNLILLDTYRNRLMERIERKKAVKEFRIVEQFYAKNNPSSEKKHLDEEQPSPNPFTTPQIHEVNEAALTGNKTRYLRSRHHPDPFITPQIHEVNEVALRSKKTRNQRSMHHPDPYDTPQIQEVNEVALTTKKTRNQKSRHRPPRKNLEKIFSQLSDCDDEDEVPSKKRSRTRRRCSSRSNKSMNFLTIQSYNSSKNEAVDSDKKSNLTIDEFPESEFLTRAEKRLCTDLGLKPAYYIRYKLFLTYIDQERSEGRYPDENLIPAHMTVAQCSRMVNFMEKVGSIKNQNLLNIADD